MRKDLEDWLKCTVRASHVLRRRPDLLFQQAANWREGTSPYRTARSRFEDGRERRPWLRRVNGLKRWPHNLLTLAGHTSRVAACDFSPDGKLIASASDDGTVGIWDSWSGERIRSIAGGSGIPARIRFLADSRHVLGSSDAFRTTVWNALDGHVTAQVDDASDEVWMATSADATKLLLYSYRDHAWKIRDPLSELSRPTAWGEAGKPLPASGDYDFIGRTGAFSRDGRRVVTVEEGRGASVRDPETREDICRIPGIQGHDFACALSPDGRLALISERHRLALWDAEGGLQLGEEPEDQNLYPGYCEFSPDGTRILVERPRVGPCLFDSSDFSQITVLRGHLEMVNAIGFSPDSRLVASASSDGTVRLWSAQRGEILATLWGHALKVVGFAFSPDSRRLVSASWDNTLSVWDVTAALESGYGHVYAIRASAISPDGNWVGTGQEDGTVLLARTSGESEARMMGRHAEPVREAAFSPDGRCFVAGSTDGTIKAWFLEGGEAFTCEGHEGAISGLAFTSGGDTLLSCSWDATVRLWDPRTGTSRSVLRGHEQCINAMSLSRDGGRLVTGSDDGTLKVWGLGTGAEIAALQGHEDDIWDCAFSPDGSRILSASRGLGSEGGYIALKLWDAATGAELKNLGGHKEFGYRCAFSPDGRWMASGAADGTCRLWDAEGNEVLVLPGGTLYGFSPDGRWLSGGSEWDISIWRVPDGSEVAHYAAASGRLIARWFPDSSGVVLADDAGCIHVLRLENLEEE